MSKDLSDCYRQYTHLSEAYYADTASQYQDVIDEVNFQLASYGGGTVGEMSMRWHDLGNRSVPRLECFNDAWVVLASFKDVIDALAEIDDQDITPKQFCQLLDSLGFIDETPRRPKADRFNSIEPAEEVLRSIKARADAARESGDSSTLSLCTDLLAAATPIVNKARERLEREERARMNKVLREMKQGQIGNDEE